MLNIGVLVSGGGTNLQAIIDAVEDGSLKECRITTIVASRSGIGAIGRAMKAGIPYTVLSRKNYPVESDFHDTMVLHMQQNKVQLVVLAGYLSMIGEPLVRAYPNAIMNVHPALIPAFSGKGCYGLVPHQKVLEAGVKVTGATVHFVDTQYDSGPIILQKAVSVLAGDTPEILQRRVMTEAEWVLLPEAIRLFSQNKLRVNGRQVEILD